MERLTRLYKLSWVLNIVLILLLAVSLFEEANEKMTPRNFFIPKDLLEKYSYLSKRILIENQNDILIHFAPLREQLKSVVVPYGDSFGFYFEYLTTGTSIGVNEEKDLNPASLGKVALAIALYQNVEQGELDINKKVSLKPEYIDNLSGSLWKRGVGSQISIKEAVEVMLEESDNTAARLLASYANEKDFEETYRGLDLPTPAENHSLITAKGYASILKSLYFASILNKDHSQELLGYLIKSKFSDKLVAALPADIKVAHKVGFWENGLFSDCGIVYLPQRPYLLCMFSRSDEQAARDRMKNISHLVYDYVSRAN